MIMGGKVVLQATPFAELRKGSDYATAIELSPWQKLDVTNQTCTPCSINNSIPLDGCSVTRLILFLQEVWLARLGGHCLVTFFENFPSTAASCVLCFVVNMCVLPSLWLLLHITQ